MTDSLSCFKSYDIRGKLGQELNEDLAYRIGRAYSEFLKPKKVVLGGDVRLSSESIKSAIARGLQDSGTDVYDIGVAGTEEVYFATSYLRMDGGIEITASHNPIDYNGMKLVREDSKPISGDSGLNIIKDLVKKNIFPDVTPEFRGQYFSISILNEYVDKLLTYIDCKAFIRPLKILFNAGNGAAGHVIDSIEQRVKSCGIPIGFIKINNTPDGSFPNGVPNPLLPECREQTSKAVIELNADLGIAFDGDFDRCFFFDELGNFIEGYYIVGLLAESFLAKAPGSTIIHDPRLIWNTREIVQKYKGIPVMSKTGHAYIKERMRVVDAIYGGEMSAHHYFKDFYYCDSGMIPWLLISELVSKKNTRLSALIKESTFAYPVSGEINSEIVNPVAAIERVTKFFVKEALAIDHTDGVSIEFHEWRFNLRCSNTESLVRLNVEARRDRDLMIEKTKLILNILNKNDY